jgi:hypothetical protein
MFLYLDLNGGQFGPHISHCNLSKLTDLSPLLFYMSFLCSLHRNFLSLLLPLLDVTFKFVSFKSFVNYPRFLPRIREYEVKKNNIELSVSLRFIIPETRTIVLTVTIHFHSETYEPTNWN